MSISRKLLLTAICCVLCVPLFSTCVNAGVDIGLDFSSRYIWRGFDLNPDNKPVLQPSITYAFGDSGFAVNVWGSFSFEDKALHETDITISYDFSRMKNVSLSVGFIHYGWYFADDFEFSDHTNQEFYATVGLPNVLFGPALTVYYDVSNGDGLYASLGIGHGLKLSGELTLELAASLGYNGGQWIDGYGFSDLNFRVSVPLKLKKISLSPFFGATFILMDEVNPGIDNEIYAGVSLAF